MKKEAAKYLGVLAAMAMMGSGGISQISDEDRARIKYKEIEAKPPKGCKDYWFTEDGRFHRDYLQ